MINHFDGSKLWFGNYVKRLLKKRKKPERRIEKKEENAKGVETPKTDIPGEKTAIGFERYSAGEIKFSQIELSFPVAGNTERNPQTWR